MEQHDLIPHLFRTEFTKITTVLCKTFGLEHIETAEDIASETFVTAMETWPYKGIPENPVAWLYHVAKNKTRNYLKRNSIFHLKIKQGLANDGTLPGDFDIDLTEQNIHDSQLQMLFAICQPSIPAESQIGLALRILCGFGTEEIANAFMSNKETINKRLFRAREKLRTEKASFELPPADKICERLEPVLRTLYLLFNEGYYSESNDLIVREDLCTEAMRLTQLLLENKQTRQPVVHALMALMCFHASRFDARKNEHGEIILYNDQDESSWNRELITKGGYHLNQSASGALLSTYHLEASIAYWHTVKADSAEKWENILQLYNRLLQLQYSPVTALNRTYALSKANGKQEAIIEAEKLQLTDNRYYYMLLGELYTGIHDDWAIRNLQRAYILAKTHTEKKLIESKLGKFTVAKQSSTNIISPKMQAE